MPGVTDSQRITPAALGSLTSVSVGRVSSAPAVVRRSRSPQDSREDLDHDRPSRPRLPNGAIPSQTKLLDLFV